MKKFPNNVMICFSMVIAPYYHRHLILVSWTYAWNSFFQKGKDQFRGSEGIPILIPLGRFFDTITDLYCWSPIYHGNIGWNHQEFAPRSSPVQFTSFVMWLWQLTHADHINVCAWISKDIERNVVIKSHCWYQQETQLLAPLFAP